MAGAALLVKEVREVRWRAPNAVMREPRVRERGGGKAGGGEGTPACSKAVPRWGKVGPTWSGAHLSNVLSLCIEWKSRFQEGLFCKNPITKD
jgi:hypothetical protein